MKVVDVRLMLLLLDGRTRVPAAGHTSIAANELDIKQHAACVMLVPQSSPL